MSSLNVHLLGAPWVERAGEALSIQRSRGLALLAYLTATRQPHTRDALATLLWPDFGQEEARNNLRRELSLLKSTVGDGCLIIERTKLAIDAGSVWSDTVAFEDLVRRADQLVKEDGRPCDECLRSLEDAAALYQGDFMDGFSLPYSPGFDEWQAGQREQLRALLAYGLSVLAEGRATQGKASSALAHAERLNAIDPLNEAGLRLLIRLLAESGRGAAALTRYDDFKRRLIRELGVEPEPETVALIEAVRQRRIVRPQPAPPPSPELVQEPPTALKEVTLPIEATPTEGHLFHNLPADTTPFIGRTEELEQLDALLTDPAVRLVTIQGVGGIGKTRLALAAAARQVRRMTGNASTFPDGVFFVPLAPLSSPSQVVAATARSVNFAFHGEQKARQQLIDFLRPRNLLLLMDNYEHLLEAEGVQFLLDLQTEAPGVTVLTTSRVRLNVLGEHVFTMSGLELPDEAHLAAAPLSDLPAAIESSSALSLFGEAARRVLPEFQVDASNVASVARICHTVLGMPLGIELAAGWLGVLGVEEIAAEIERNLDFLETDMRDIPQRQSSLRAVFDTSWRLLTGQEQSVLRSLTVFRGGFTRAAAEAVAGASLRNLLSLQSKSWLQFTDTGRYQIHELLRQYAAQELASQSGNENAVRARHADYFAGTLQRMESDIRGSAAGTAYAAIEGDLDNVQAAFDWLVEAGELPDLVRRMMPSLFRYLESRYSYYILHRQILGAQEKARELGFRREYAVFLCIRSAFFFNGYPTRFMDYQWVDAVVPGLMQEAWEIMPAQPVENGFWSTLLGWQYGRFVDYAAGLARLRDLIALFRDRGLRWETAFALQSYGRLLSPRPWDTIQHGRYGESRESLEEAFRLFTELGDEREAAVTMLFLSFERQAAGLLDEALRFAVDAQSRLRLLGDQTIAANVNWQLAELYQRVGRLDESLRLLHEMTDLLIASGRTYLAVAALSRESYEAVRYGDLGYALQIRQKCIALSRATGNEPNNAWDAWELGEVYRVMGETVLAREWYERALVQFEAAGNDVGISFYHRGLGDLALTDGKADDALARFEMAYKWASGINHIWVRSYVCARMGLALTKLGDHGRAGTVLTDALQIGRTSGDAGGLVLVALAAAAALFKISGHEAAAERVSEVVFSHPLTWNETRQETADRSGIDAKTAGEKKQVRPFELGPTIDWVLAELAAVQSTDDTG